MGSRKRVSDVSSIIVSHHPSSDVGAEVFLFFSRGKYVGGGDPFSCYLVMMKCPRVLV